MNSRKTLSSLSPLPFSLASLFAFLYRALFVFLVAGQLLRLQFTPSIALYPHDLTILLINSLWLITSASRFSLSKLPRLIYWVPAFALIALLSLLVNFARLDFTHPLVSASGVLYLLRWLNLGLLLPVTYHLLSTHRLSLHLDHWLLNWALAIAILGLVQYIFIPDTRFLYAYGWDDHLNRLISTIFDPAFTGLLLILGLILAELRSKPNHIIIASFYVSIALTYSRASYLTLIAIIFLLGFKLKSLRLVVSRLTIFLILIILLPHTEGEGVNLSRTYSITSRVESSEIAINQASHFSLLGIGFNNYRLLTPNIRLVPNHNSSPDNSFLLLLVTTGLVGTAVYLYFWGQALTWGFHHSATIFISLSAISLHSLTNNSLFYPFIMIWWWLLLASELSYHQKLLPAA